jgi:hypothetical protein
VQVVEIIFSISLRLSTSSFKDAGPLSRSDFRGILNRHVVGPFILVPSGRVSAVVPFRQPQGFRQQPIQRRAIEELAGEYYGEDPARCADADRRICVAQHQVGAPPWRAITLLVIARSAVLRGRDCWLTIRPQPISSGDGRLIIGTCTTG